MIIGHLPAGYITCKLFDKRLEKNSISRKSFFFWGICGALAPDFDMIYFYVFDHRRHHHHTYFSHWPIVWLTLFLASLIWFYGANARAKAALALVFTFGGFLHLILDTIVGDIWWLAPFVEKPFAFATVPALYQPWWLNFIWHWSFGFELLVVFWAIFLWRKRPAV